MIFIANFVIYPPGKMPRWQKCGVYAANLAYTVWSIQIGSNMVYRKPKFFSIKLWVTSYKSIVTHILGAQENCLIEIVLLSTHNMMFWLRNMKINFWWCTTFLGTWYTHINSSFLRDKYQNHMKWLIFCCVHVSLSCYFIYRFGRLYHVCCQGFFLCPQGPKFGPFPNGI